MPSRQKSVRPKALRWLGRRHGFISLAQYLLQAREKVHWNWKYDSGIFLDADFRQRLQVAKLHTDRFSSQQVRGVHQALCGREFALRVTNLGSLFALGLG